MAEEEKQDLSVAEARPPDQNWQRMQPIQITATRDRLDQPSQRVTIRNTSRAQKHIVIDRHMVGHELQPGQQIEDVEMLVSEIEYFLRERSPARRDALGRPKPIHPIEIVGLKTIDHGEPQKQPQRGKAAAA